MGNQHRQYHCVLVENEPLAIDMMLEYIGQREDLKLIQVIDTVDDCDMILENEKKIDILFLDIKIRGGELFDFLIKLTDKNIIVVLTTAYATQELCGLSPRLLRYFISKPISLRDFNECMDKVLLKN